MAAANVLPDAAQDAVATVLSQVGIEVPRSAPEVRRSDHPAATGEEIAEIATTTDASDVDKGAEISEAASGGISQAGEHGPGAEADAPGAAGVGSADGASDTGTESASEASGGASDGTETASEASGGAREHRSGNLPTP